MRDRAPFSKRPEKRAQSLIVRLIVPLSFLISLLRFCMQMDVGQKCGFEPG